MSWRQVAPAATAIALGLAVPAIVYLLARPLALLVLAFTLAAALSPAADALDRRMPRTIGVVLVYAALAGVLAFLLFSVVPPLWGELQNFINHAPELMDRAQQWISGWAPVQDVPIRDATTALLKNFQDTLVRIPLDALSATFDALVVVFLSLYLLLSGPRLKHFVLTLCPASRRGRASRMMARTGRAMGGYVRGVAISGVLVGLLAWGALALAGVEYRRTLALAAALGEFVPYIGPLLAAVPAVLVALATSPAQGAIVGLIYLGIQQVESYVITPNVMKSQTDVPPALVIFALACGFAAGGLLGALAAIPIFAALRVFALAAAPIFRRRSGVR